MPAALTNALTEPPPKNAVTAEPDSTNCISNST
jgi:hypothetical protein